jgi:prepilin-type N-terminal cleavage/methylation domain-containing protein
MRTLRRTASAGERGYSLAEMLTVVAIIGALSLFIVPNFISMYRQSKLKTSIRQFANDLRAARQHAVTKSSTVRVAYDDSSRRYYIFESDDEGATWQPLGTNPKYLDETAYFENDPGADKFTDTIDEGALGDLEDIIFERTGIARVPTGRGIVWLKSQHTDIALPRFKITVGSAGTVGVE